jgi:hypothetical protein
MFAFLGIAVLIGLAVHQVEASGALLAGYSKMFEDGAPGGSLAATASAFLHPSPSVGLGAEVGYYGYGSHPAPVGETEIADGIFASFDGKFGFSAIQATAQTLLQGTRGTTRPFATAGVGLYVVRTTLKGEVRVEDQWTQHRGRQWYEESDNSAEIGLNLGGGLHFVPEHGRAGFVVDARFHVIPGALLDESSMNSFALMAGIVF